MFFCEPWSIHSHKTECRRRPKETQSHHRHPRVTSAAGAQGHRSHQNKQHFWLLFCLFFDPETTLLLVSYFFLDQQCWFFTLFPVLILFCFLMLVNFFFFCFHNFVMLAHMGLFVCVSLVLYYCFRLIEFSISLNLEASLQLCFWQQFLFDCLFAKKFG